MNNYKNLLPIFNGHFYETVSALQSQNHTQVKDIVLSMMNEYGLEAINEQPMSATQELGSRIINASTAKEVSDFISWVFFRDHVSSELKEALAPILTPDSLGKKYIKHVELSKDAQAAFNPPSIWTITKPFWSGYKQQYNTTYESN